MDAQRGREHGKRRLGKKGRHPFGLSGEHEKKRCDRKKRTPRGKESSKMRSAYNRRVELRPRRTPTEREENNKTGLKERGRVVSGLRTEGENCVKEIEERDRIGDQRRLKKRRIKGDVSKFREKKKQTLRGGKKKRARSGRPKATIGNRPRETKRWGGR